MRIIVEMKIKLYRVDVIFNKIEYYYETFINLYKSEINEVCFFCA